MLAVLNMGSGDPDESSTLPVMLQWVNKRSEPFTKRDLEISRVVRTVLQRLADARQVTRSVNILQERFQLGDARRVALMESARMLANRMEMEVPRPRCFDGADPTLALGSGKKCTLLPRLRSGTL